MIHLRHIFFSAAVALASVAVHAREQSSLGMLEEMASGSRMTVNYSFSGTSPKGGFSGSGKVTYQDGAFIFVSDAVRVYDDLKSRWTVNNVSREAVAETSSPGGSLSDTSSVLRMFGVNPKGAVVEVVKGKDGVPCGINASLKDGTKVRVTFTSKRCSAKGALSDFSFDSSSLDSSWTVTDLR